LIEEIAHDRKPNYGGSKKQNLFASDGEIIVSGIDLPLKSNVFEFPDSSFPDGGIKASAFLI